MSHPRCPDCGVDMEGGFLLDAADGGQNKQAAWIEGAPDKRWYGLRVKGLRRFPMYAWRCPRCTLVRLYAPESG